MTEHPATPPADEGWRTCVCIYCERRRELDRIQKATPEEIVEHITIELDKFTQVWDRDWKLLFDGFAERTGLTRQEVLLYFCHLNLHGLRLTTMRLTDSYERAVAKAMEIHKDENPPDDWKTPQ